MGEISHVYVDMDGVLCSFSQGVLRLFGSEEPELDDLLCEGWDGLPAVINRGRPSWAHVTDEQMMRAVRDAGHQFWADLPVLPWAYRLIGQLERSGVDYALLTTPAGGESAMGKFQWVLKHLPHMERRVILARDKWRLAAPGRLLIDDGGHNVYAWEMHDGQALHWPQPHNIGGVVPPAALDAAVIHAEKTLADLLR